MDEHQQQQEPEPVEEVREEHPRGTLVLMMIYLVIIIGLWGSVYLTLLQRS